MSINWLLWTFRSISLKNIFNSCNNLYNFKMDRPNIKCLGCGFTQPYHSTRNRCPECGRLYHDRISGYDFESF